MKLIRKSRLWFKQDKSDKVYEVDLCELSPDRYVVNFRYGRRGGKLREGVKTKQPVGREEAEEIFTSLVVSKQNKGYRDDTATGSSATTEHAESGDRVNILLKRLRDRSTKPKQLNRTLWRIGELRLREAVPLLLDLGKQRKSMRDYCLAWALGRCGDAQALPFLSQLRHGSKDPAVKRIAQEALLALADAEGRQKLLDEVLAKLPSALSEAIANPDKLTAALHAHLAHAEATGFVVLEQLYLLAADYPAARDVLLQELRNAPLKPNYFQRIRRIFKAAEFRQDEEVFGLLTLRFEITPPYFYRSSWGGDHAIVHDGDDIQYVKLSKEIARPDSRLAYSNHTRDYLRRRAWRSLRRLGEIDDDTYVSMALGVLLPMTDDHAEAPRRSEIYQYDYSRGWADARQLVQTYEYDAYAGYLVFNHILYSNSPRYALAKSGRVWIKQATEMAEGQREESFPELWDRQPEALLRLLRASRCEPVHQFAATALATHGDFCAKLDATVLASLLRQPYAITNRLALKIARERYDPDEPELALIEALLNAELEEARQQGLSWLEAARSVLLSDTALVARLLGHRHREVRGWTRQQLATISFSKTQTDALIARLLARVLELSPDDAAHAAIAKDIDACLLEAFAEPLRDLDLAVISDLLRHPLVEVQVLAGRLLVNHQCPAEALPPALFKTLLEASSSQVQGLGVELFGQLPDNTLLSQHELLTTFCVAEQTEVRQSAHAIVQRLAPDHPEFAQQIMLDLLPYVFRKEPVAGFHANLLLLLQSEALQPALVSLERETLWRLLKARANAAQILGAHLLQQQIDPAELSVRQWAWLGNHQLLKVREWAWNAYRAQPDRIKIAASDALRILDSDWDDSREFGIQFFAETLVNADWTPALLVGICDSSRDDVQAFGRELITRFFEDQHGPEYLLKLSQHPSSDVQLFTSNFLERFAADQPERLEQLLPYFATVLSQVNRGRVAKSRVLAFLHQEALKNEGSARLAAQVFARQSASVVLADKAACLEAMRDIQQVYPSIELPLTIEPVALSPTLVPKHSG